MSAPTTRSTVGGAVPPPRTEAERASPTLSCSHEAGRGSHFVAWEEPEPFAAEVQAASPPLR